ncbi:iron ABC transporter permease [Pantoea ananatis]|jgi:iron complex transport system permease protein|uniref:Iron chelate uptake ABC transporter family permease subunit n=1 Tax=Pantoea ananas TaxID=553 RepID=A0A8A4K739_PANAN|nr:MULTISPECIES: iron chelate uptake ABC transporter family permease subunit [Pantoea]KNA27501.1 iron ABC transporter permease [Pantoea ananatis]MCS3402876.1 iron chelate uptake ABC transporter family permease subunit [Pantoea sp. B566]NCU06980.1 iron chelate uptake ABC transporter family permease subunit [Pantoea ananatis]QTC47272.1 iron chelate uptake ABC transporter family permease subunit [Pantoea ananatis]HCP27827.1 iron ABC transporter permease [Pantoea ananatis]
MKYGAYLIGLGLLSTLVMLSLVTGVTRVSLIDLWHDAEMREILFVSRFPRTVALVLAGSAMSVAGQIMQMLTQNRFVEPSVVGTTQSASLGLLLVMVWYPAAPVIVKMCIASLFALAGTVLFMLLIQRIRQKSAFIVPLAGIMLGAVFSSVTTFLGMQFDILQSLGSWESGDFSSVMQGRYELIWIVGMITLLAALIADRFTVAGLGQDFSVNVGLNYRQIQLTGMAMIAIVSGVVIVVVGVLPFLGLVVPNIVSMIFGDNLRRTVPWVAMTGAILVLSCDILGRLIIYPFEVPVSALLGVLGAAVFLVLIIRGRRYGN